MQAVLATGDNHDELRQFCGEQAYSRSVMAARHDEACIGYVWSEAWRVWLGVHVGDWVERGANGQLVVVRPHHMPARYQNMIGAS